MRVSSLPVTIKLTSLWNTLIVTMKYCSGGVYTLRNAFPIQMSEIALNYAQNDIFEEFTVTWQYSHYDVEITVVG